MKNLFETMNDHISIRSYKDKEIDKENIDDILDYLMKSPTSIGMQMASLIKVEDPNIKEKISKVCNQDYIATIPGLIVFVVDLYRNTKIKEEIESKRNEKVTMDKFFQAFTDGVIMATNFSNLLEAKGYGTVFLGSILNNSQKIIELLNLPKFTFPIVAIGYGYSDGVETKKKPKMDKDLRVFTDSYKILPSYLEAFKEYDEIFYKYYEENNRDYLETFTSKAAKSIDMGLIERDEMLKVIRSQGFDLKV